MELDVEGLQGGFGWLRMEPTDKPS